LQPATTLLSKWLKQMVHDGATDRTWWVLHFPFISLVNTEYNMGMAQATGHW